MAALGDRPGVPDQPEGTGRPERSGGDGRRSGRESRTEAIDEALERAGLPSPRERAREEPGTRDRAENIRFSDAMTDVELTAKGDQVVNREGDDKSRADRFSRQFWKNSESVAKAADKATEQADKSLNPPTGHAESRPPHPVVEANHHGVAPADTVTALAMTGALTIEFVRSSMRRINERREGKQW